MTLLALQKKFHIELYFAESKWGYIIPPRSFIWNIGKKIFQTNNIVNSIVPKEFNEFIQNALDKREKMHMMKRVKLVAKSEFAKLFKNSKCSSSKIFDKVYGIV